MPHHCVLSSQHIFNFITIFHSPLINIFTSFRECVRYYGVSSIGRVQPAPVLNVSDKLTANFH